MALNIKNEETVALVRELAQKTGQSQTSAIETAVRAQLGRLHGDEHARKSQERYDRAMRIIREIHTSMTDEERKALRNVEQDLYDDNGLFA